jgi:hypothetical protein
VSSLFENPENHHFGFQYLCITALALNTQSGIRLEMISLRSVLLFSGGIVLGIGCYYYLVSSMDDSFCCIFFAQLTGKSAKADDSKSTPTPTTAQEIEKQDEDYLASLLEDQKKDRLRALQQQEELIHREKDELERAIEESAKLYLRFVFFEIDSISNT